MCVAQKAADSDELNLYLLSAKTNEPVGTAVNLTKSNTCVSTMKEHETRSYLTVCGGDFDGDGKDEAAGYVPVTDARNGVNASHVDIYDINTESSTKTFEKRSTVYLADLEGTQPGKTLDDSKTPFITSLAVYDFDGDGKEELATSFSHAYFPNARFIPANTKKAKEWKKMGSYLSVLSMKTDSMEEQYGRRLAFTGEEYGMPKCFLEPAGKAMKEVDALKKAYKENDMLSIWTGPDVTWSTTKEGYQEMLEYCLSENVRYSMHIKETEVDNEMCGRYYGKDIVDMLEEIGFLTDKFLAVHCVNLTPHDIERFAKYGVSISHNPAPNLYLGSGIPPIPESLAAGVNVSIGTDGAASNNSTDMLESMKLAALIQKGIHRDAAVISADDIIHMATAGGAKAIGMADKLGTLESGKNADLIIFDPNHLKSAPMHDAKATVVYASSEENIDTTIVNGKVVYQGGKFTCGIDERSLIDEINSELGVLKKQIADK